MELKRNPLLYIVIVVAIILVVVVIYFQFSAKEKEITQTEDLVENCGEGTAIYKNNDLCWQRSANTDKVSNWQAASDYCENLVLGEREDWRLPTTDELKSIVDDSYTPAINPTYFEDTNPSQYWTSSEYKEGLHWYIHFELGYQGFGQDFRDDFYVRCVRENTLF